MWARWKTQLKQWTFLSLQKETVFKTLFRVIVERNFPRTLLRLVLSKLSTPGIQYLHISVQMQEILYSCMLGGWTRIRWSEFGS